MSQLVLDRVVQHFGDTILASAQRGSSRVDLKVDARSGAVSQR